MSKVSSYEIMEIAFDGETCGIPWTKVFKFKYPQGHPEEATIEVRTSSGDIVYDVKAKLVNEALRTFVDRHPFAFESEDSKIPE
jgi:hypothetical protein